MKIVGISGWRGNGKTTLANLLAIKHGYQRVSFAEPLKALAKQVFPFDDVDLTSPKRKEQKWRGHDWSPREFLVNLGEFARFHEPSIWLNKGISQCKDADGKYVFDDVRYFNEADAIKALGGKLIRLNRYEKDNPYGKHLTITSETQLDDYKFDMIIHEFDNKDIPDLRKQADKIEELW